MPNDTKYVLTVFDCIQELFPSKRLGNIRMRHMKKRAIQRADSIIAISENTKRDIIRLYGVPDEKISVVYLGGTEHQNNTGDQEKNLPAGLPEKYILFVGMRDGYKNFDTFLQAIKKVTQSDKEIKVVCVGKDFTEKENKYLFELGIKDIVISIRADDNELAAIYRNALCFVYPSKYEGFGIPILEAFEFECPVAASDIGCFREVGGDAALYFSPDSAENIAETINKIIKDEEKRKTLIAAGSQRKQLFSWDSTAEKIKEIYINTLK